MSNFELAHLPDWLEFIGRRMRHANVSTRALDVVEKRCADETAVCLAGPDGVVVVAPDESSGTMRLIVLLAVSCGIPGAFRRQEEALAEIAREFEAVELGFKTSRDGWARLLGKHWRREGDLFLRSV